MGDIVAIKSATDTKTLPENLLHIGTIPYLLHLQESLPAILPNYFTKKSRKGDLFSHDFFLLQCCLLVI
jgi:hypothetical protein